MLFFFLLCFRVRVVKSEDDVLVVCPTILTEDGMQAQHLGATLALYRLVKGQVGPFRCFRNHEMMAMQVERP